MDSILALREEASLGGNAWPRVYSAGAMIDGAPATYGDATEVTTAAQARRAVDARAVAGVDFIKTYTRITPELFKALLDEANALNLKVTAHLGLTDAETASRLGVASIEHMTGIPEAANPRGAEAYAEHGRRSSVAGTLREELATLTRRAFAASLTWWIGTSSLFRRWCYTILTAG
jgi:imidazolonepropionase-like amidohydrolase